VVAKARSRLQLPASPPQPAGRRTNVEARG
jgi:hypothetical protein